MKNATNACKLLNSWNKNPNALDETIKRLTAVKKLKRIPKQVNSLQDPSIRIARLTNFHPEINCWSLSHGGLSS